MLKEYFENIKNAWLERNRSPLPPPLASRFYSLLLPGLAFCAVAVILAIAKKTMGVAGFPLLCGGILIALAISFKLSISIAGYQVIEGHCIDVERPLINIRRKGSAGNYCLVETAEGVIRIPVINRKQAPPEGSILRIYTPKNEEPVFLNGALNYTAIYGYAIIPDEAEFA